MFLWLNTVPSQSQICIEYDTYKLSVYQDVDMARSSLMKRNKVLSMRTFKREVPWLIPIS